MKQPLWRLTDVSVTGLRRPRLDRVTLDIPPGATAILGPSGAGKSTLLNLLVDFEQPAAGSVIALISSLQRLPVCWAPPGHGLWPHVSVRRHLSSIGPDANGPATAAVDRLLTDFDLLPLADVYPGTLSQGERDRLAVARALAADPEVLVLDEPLAHVPDAAARRYWSRLRAACEQRKMSVVFATHDLAVALREAGHVVVLEEGRVAFAGSVEDYRRATE
jgi:iron(III) transport system ATP-binding protein